MGYYTRFDGFIACDPPVPYLRFKDITPGYSLRLVVDEQLVETEEGVLTRKVLEGIEPASEDSMKAYGIEEDLQSIIWTLKDYTTFSGAIRAEGEESGDIWRMTIKDNELVTERARLIWDDGTIEKVR